MVTAEEIERRVEQTDTPRTAQRSTAAKQVFELCAQRRAAIAEQLGEVERELGEVLAAAHEVIDIDELARFTDIPATDLSRWLTARKPTRTKRRRAAPDEPGASSDPSRPPAQAKTTSAGQADTRSVHAVPRAGVTDARVMAKMT